jgi:RNA polymerase sigma-70 factor (sigma-E family)
MRSWPRARSWSGSSTGMPAGWNRTAEGSVLVAVMTHTTSDDEPDSTTPSRSPAELTFEDFFHGAWPGACRLASFLTQDTSVAEDLVQDAMAKMYTSWGRVDQPHAYLRTAVVNRCRNWQRRERVQRLKLPFVASPTAVDFGADDLADVVAALPFRQRAVIVLRYQFALSEAEIAEALGCRPGTVKSLASRALAQLKKAITS